MKDSLTLWRERPDFCAYHRLDGLAKNVSAVLIVATADHLGLSLESSLPADLEEIVALCVHFADQVYGVTATPRIDALSQVPDSDLGQAFLAVERLIQPNGFQ